MGSSLALSCNIWSFVIELDYGIPCASGSIRGSWNTAIPNWRLWASSLGDVGRRQQAYHSAKIYKEKTKKWHNKRIKQKEFKPGDKVLLFNSSVKLFGHGKLRSKCEGPYTVVDVASHGSITLLDDCNTRFTKGHKPSNHIRVRIKSHVYTTEWTVYHSTYHVKRYNKVSTDIIYYINDKCLIQSMRKRKTYMITLVGSWAGRHSVIP